MEKGRSRAPRFSPVSARFPGSAVGSLALAPPVGSRLIGDTCMVIAIGDPDIRARTTEAELGRGRIADRPAAHPLAQFHDGHMLLEFRNGLDLAAARRCACTAG